jgi:hypothetical protein
MAEALKVDEERHAQELEDAYLVTRAKRRTLATERQEPLILEGIPVHPPERRRTGIAAPPPTEASEVESLLPLTHHEKEHILNLVQQKNPRSPGRKPFGPTK